jgi:hypothetical protein
MYTGDACTVNFGQQPFVHTPPTGHRALNSKNLATPSAAQIVKPQRHFDTILYSGTGSSNSITGLEFAPDFIWAKRRNTSGHHHLLIDTIRGGSKSLQANTNDSENSNANRDMTFLKDGIRWNSDTGNANANGGTYAVWCWKGGGAAVTNTDGNITSSVSANQESGFSIVTYTGNGNSPQTIGHGLGKAPSWVIVKDRDNSMDWVVKHKNSSSNKILYLQTDSAEDTGTGSNNGIIDNLTSATTTTVTLTNNGSGNMNMVNKSSTDYVMYCWAEIPGFSKFGTYTGNGSSDGPFIHLGFRPAWFMQKKTSGTGGWYIFDSKRSGFNVDNDILVADVDDAEYDGASYPRLDFLASGIKWRDSGSSVHNASGATYIYMAFAERPSGTIFGIDANAR